MDGESVTLPEVAATAASARPRRWRRLLKRLGIVLLALFVVLTAFSLVYNAATSARAAPPAGLMYARTGAIQTRYRV